MSAGDQPTGPAQAAETREEPSRSPSSPHPDTPSIERLTSAAAPSRDAMLALYL
jgi:hypothetical protein